MHNVRQYSGGLATVRVGREKQKQRIIWDELLIKGKLALVTCALTLVFTSSLFAASDPADGRTLNLAICPDPTEGFEPILGCITGSSLLLSTALP